MSDARNIGRLLDLYRNYLRMLARVEIGRQLQAKVDASDLDLKQANAASHFRPDGAREERAAAHFSVA
jgi:hypothetical protein